MIPNDYKTSLRIPSQLPEFIRDDVNYETFVAFVEAYYEWLELANTANANTTIASTSGEGVTYASKNLSNYSDIDSTLDGFLKYYISDFLPYFPEDALADKSKVLKIAKQLYQSKGTPASYKLLFRLLYNSSAEILNTGELVFRASAGDWYIPKYLKVGGDSLLWLTAGMESYRVFGDRSKSFATIEKIILNGTKCDVYISNIERLFQSGENVIVVDSNNQEVYVKDGLISLKSVAGSSNVTGKIVGALSTISIDPKYRGSTYNVGDPVVVYGGLSSNTAIGGTAEVSEITTGSIQRINTLHGGFGYIPDQASIIFGTFSNTTIQFTPIDRGALAHVATFDGNPILSANINTIPLDRISVKQNIPLNNLNYYFANTSVIASANANTRLIDAFTFDSPIESFPISSVVVDNGGGGFSQLPIAIAKSHYFDVDTGSRHNVDDMGQLAPIQIINPGIGYGLGDRITIDGGWGFGATANITAVDGSGSITSVEYVQYEDFTNSYPLGGMGYKITDILGDGLVPALTCGVSSRISVSSIVQGKMPLWDIVYQTYDTYANAFFGGIVNGIDSSNNILKVYNVQGTLNATRPLISLANTQNTVTATSNTVSGIAAELFVPGILGAGADFQLTTDRIGSVTKIRITDPGEDYVSTPNVSLRVQDLCVTGLTNLESIQSGLLLFQGEDVRNEDGTIDVDYAPYQSYVDRISVLTETGTLANNVYNLRVYNYSGLPFLYNENNSANTILHVDTVTNPFPTMRLTTEKDSSLGYSNGVKTYGDGVARATSKFLNGLIFGQGTYLNLKGQPSSYSVLQSRDYNDFTYILSVERPISKYRNILKNLLHPAGMKVIGRDILNNQKAFGVKHDSGTSQIKSLSYWANWPVGNPYAYVTMNVSGIIANSMIRVTDGGTGYSPSTTISINAIDGRGTGATAVANIANGVIVSINVTNQGSGYILSPDIIISDSNTHGLRSITANVNSYGSNGYITFTGGVGSITANAYMHVKTSGEVNNITILNSGYYTSLPTAIPPSGNAILTIVNTSNSFARITASVDLSSNVMIIQNMNGGSLEQLTQNTHWITVYPEQTGGNCKIYSTTKQYYDSNSTIILEDDTFLTFPNVIYGHANTNNLAISIAQFSVANTPVYDIINNGEYSNTQNHLEDIIFAGDNLTVAGNTYVIQSVDYYAGLIYVLNSQALLQSENNNEILTEDGVPGNSNNIIAGSYTLSFGTAENPVPMTINRSISTSNVFIKALL